MVVGLDPDNEALHAAVSGLWNAAYALGWAAGPLLGGALYEDFGFQGYSEVIAALAFVYGVLMLAASAANVRPDSKRSNAKKELE
jgi:MFS family permease